MHLKACISGDSNQVAALLVRQRHYIVGHFNCGDAEPARLGTKRARTIDALRVHDKFEELPTHGLPLGVTADLPYDESLQLRMHPGDFLLVITDGFFEWENAAGEPFGTDRICDIVREYRDDSTAQIIDHLYRRVVDFVGDTKQVDDLTAVVVKRR